MGIIIKTIKRSLGNGVRKEDDIIPIIKDFMERHKISDDKYTINIDKSVDVYNNVSIYKDDLINGKIPFKFGKVTGYFDCHECGLTSLDGSPDRVYDFFYCSNNELTSLEGCPNVIKGSFDCSANKLTLLEGCPEKVGGDFYCDYNQLTSLEGCPKKVGGQFYCGVNKQFFTRFDILSVCNVIGNIYND